MAASGGYELPATNLALATLLAATGPGALRLGPRLSRARSALTLLGAAAGTAFALKQLLGQQAAPRPTESTVAGAAASAVAPAATA